MLEQLVCHHSSFHQVLSKICIQVVLHRQVAGQLPQQLLCHLQLVPTAAQSPLNPQQMGRQPLPAHSLG